MRLRLIIYLLDTTDTYLYELLFLYRKLLIGTQRYKGVYLSTLALQYINDTNRRLFYLDCSLNDVFFFSVLSCSMNYCIRLAGSEERYEVVRQADWLGERETERMYLTG